MDYSRVMKLYRPIDVVVDALRCRPLTKAMSRAEALAEELRLRRSH